MKVKAEYINRIITVIIPSFIIIGGIFFVPYMAYKHLVTDSFLLKLLVNVGGVIGVIVITILVNPFFVKIARLKRGTITLDGSLVKWNFIFINKSVDLSQSHAVEIFSGPGIQASQNTLMIISNDNNSVNICLPRMERHEAVDIFENNDFIDTVSIPPEEGSGGFNLFPEKGDHRIFFGNLLKLSWEKREMNRAYRNFLLFPWDKKPEPNIQYTRLLKDSTEINNYKENADIIIGSDLFVLPEYILALDVSKEQYWLFPLGNCTVEISPRTGLQGGTTGGVTHYDVLELKGKDNTGEIVKVDVAKQIDIGDEFYKEQYFLRYCEKVNTM